MPAAYWLARALLQPFCLVYFRLRRLNTGQIPADGPLLLASNHCSFLDPFIIGLCIGRPLRFVAKVELFDKAWKAHLLLALGAFPIRRGACDELALETAQVILERGGAVGIFPEGTRIRNGPLGEPKSGVGHLALVTGAPIVPVAIAGTDQIRRGWRIRPRKVVVRCGLPVMPPRPIDPAVIPALANDLTARVWSCVELQWEWLGGTPPIRSAAVIGGGSWGTAVAALLAGGGATVQLGCRTPEQTAEISRDRVNGRYLPGVPLPDSVVVRHAAELDLESVDLVCLAVPSRGLADAIEAIDHRLPDGVGVLVLSKGLVAPSGELPSERVVARTGARPVACLGGPAHAAEAVAGRAALVVAASDPVFGAQLERVLREAGCKCEVNDDVVGVQLAGCAKNAAALAAGLALSGGANEAGAAAARVFAECHRLARARGAGNDSFIGVAGTGDLIATVLSPGSRNRRAGELLGAGMDSGTIERVVGQAAEALDFTPLLAGAMRRAGIDAPATSALAVVVEGARPEEEPGAAVDGRSPERLSAVA